MVKGQVAFHPEQQRSSGHKSNTLKGQGFNEFCLFNIISSKRFKTNKRQLYMVLCSFFLGFLRNTGWRKTFRK